MSKPIEYNPHLGYKDDVIRENIRLVHSIANKYRKRCTTTISYEDVVSEGVIGMIKAFHNFNPDNFEGKVAKFSTYAVPAIKGEILRFFRDKSSLLKVSRTLKEVAAKIRWKGLEEVPPEVIASKLDISTELAVKTLHYMETASVSYLEQPVFSDGGSEITGYDQLGCADDLSGILIQEFSKYLTPKEKKILLLRYEGKSQGEIGEIIGKSQVHVSRLLERIKPKLLKYMTNPESEEFMVKSEVNTRRINADEAKRLGVKTVLDEIEWYSGDASSGVASVSLNVLGLHISRQAAEELNLKAGDFIQVGFNAGLLRIVIRKAKIGTKLNKSTGTSGSVATNNKAIGKWVLSKNVSRKRYALQFDETSQVHFIQLEAAGQEAGTA